MQAEEYNLRGNNRFSLTIWTQTCGSCCYSVCFWSGKELVDYITQYLVSIRDRKVIPDVKPGYMKELLPDTAPTEPEDWDSIFNDFEKVIMPGVSSYFHPSSHQ